MVRNGMSLGAAIVGLFVIGLQYSAGAAASSDMQRIGAFSIDRVEVTVGAFARFAAATGMVTKAEREGGGLVYEAGWEQKSGWTWRTPFGQVARDDEPAVHVTFDEAQAYCRWAGKRLPTEREWLAAAYTERRIDPPIPFEAGKTYPYPTGATPDGANCLGECGKGKGPAIDHSAVLSRGIGHAPAGTTLPGVNGLYDMGANVWEWVDIGDGRRQGTRGGSWWYGAAQMRADYDASKPRDMAVVYIGFRCVRDAR
ncbi:MAG: formylglycine-generating enzyme family protein [Alphaproteobacteria bacterium]|nr:formylglycine-generating enzyme family protein [Alphaproteobacteria bacterium]